MKWKISCAERKLITDSLDDQTCEAREEFGSVSTIFPPFGDTSCRSKEKKFKAAISGRYRPTTRLLEFYQPLSQFPRVPSFLPSFPSANFYRPLSLNRVLLFPRWSFYARRGRKRRKKSRGRKNHGEAISRKRPSVTCHSRDYTIIAFPFHDQIYEYEMRTIFFNKCEFPPCSQIIIQTRRIERKKRICASILH